MENPVSPELNGQSGLMIVGEAPGVTEVALGVPFVGKSGKILMNMLAKFGITRTMCDWTNVCPVRPPNNDIEKFFPHNQPNEIIQQGVHDLHELIYKREPDAILACGQTALWALTGLKGINKRRGSIYSHQGIPVVASLHPAYLIYNPSSAFLFAHDLERFSQVVSAPESLKPRKREFLLHPTSSDISEFLREVVSQQTLLAIDIETVKIPCVGFSLHPSKAIVLPMEETSLIQSLLATPNPKVFHNAPYDVAWLRQRKGFVMRGELHDTLLMSQAYHPEVPRSLDTLTSLYTNEPYYKDEYDLEGDDFLSYNAKDVAVTQELAGVLLAKLTDTNLMEVYERRQKLLPIAIKMSCRGLSYDKHLAKSLASQTVRRGARWQTILDGRAGRKINVFSSPQVTKLLYVDLKLPVQHNSDTGRPTTNATALTRLYGRLRDRKTRQIIRALLNRRGLEKLRTTYLNTKMSEDGRMRTSFNPGGTETGRWTASAFLITEGTNLQTVPSAWKQCFQADPGMIFWIADYSQIEARISSYLAKDKASIAIFESGGDIHRFNASLIFNVPIDRVTSLQRRIAKTGVHLLNYGGGKDVLMDSVNENALESSFWLTEDMAQTVREAYLNKFDRMVEWQNETYEEGKRTRRLTNPFGTQRIFLGPLMGEGSYHTKKEMISFCPQSTVPDMLGMAMVELDRHPPVPGFEMLLNIHDALMGQAPKESVDVWAPAVLKAMDIPIPIHGQKIHIPVEIKIGTRWSHMETITV